MTVTSEARLSIEGQSVSSDQLVSGTSCWSEKVTILSFLKERESFYAITCPEWSGTILG